MASTKAPKQPCMNFYLCMYIIYSYYLVAHIYIYVHINLFICLYLYLYAYLCLSTIYSYIYIYIYIHVCMCVCCFQLPPTTDRNKPGLFAKRSHLAPTSRTAADTLKSRKYRRLIKETPQESEQGPKTEGPWGTLSHPFGEQLIMTGCLGSEVWPFHAC